MTLPEARAWPERCSGCGYHEATQGCACVGSLKFHPGGSPRRVSPGQGVRAMPAAGNAATVLSGDAAVLSPSADEWDLFVTVLRSAARDGRVHQSAVRPLLRGRMQAKHIGLAYRRAIREGLLREVTRERSDDEHGRNTNKWEPVYELRSAA